ncbi:hypothetical protein HPG69_019120 [Diceros bicornis minor]|uniref:Ig-like domain-containing protein n=1 Tax=Diceros bicornis minor TaxID=77932 RepID=A0A7J7FM06_DICBM|nr:hypothetical protein HPG69_019120 [Diceros bicornis minor]
MKEEIWGLRPGTSSQAVVTQEPSLTVIPGGTVTLTCGYSTGAVVNGHYPSWFQQKSGQVPTTLIYDIHIKNAWAPSRFSGSILGGKAALSLSLKDEAEYYCWHTVVLSMVADSDEQPRHNPDTGPACVYE